MADIPMRSYLHEIEKHIESGRTDQAIAHCRHILQSYPKYVDAYRLLGKAYLESQRYGDAGDIFQRVLSSVPDDFVSHVGMSIIREDEGNLDEAIWHMERGFEVQPSNNAIQEELRRLYGKRDHVEPPKIRLTRGALARMYYKGELYQQSIGEIRATLADSPDRLDLQALLADIYLKINQRVEAADAALAVLHRLPNCLITIRVMIQVLSSTEREMEQKTYRQRLAQLDPYSVFAAVDAPSSDAVSEHAIKLEKLDWKPDTSLTGEAGQPAWAASLGVDLGDLTPAKEESLPDWLSGVSTEPGTPKEADAIRSSAFTFDEAEPAPAGQVPLIPDSSEEEIPDWLRQAGWGPSTGLGEQAEAQPAESGPTEMEPPESLPLAETGASFAQADDQLAEGEMPDWLKAMAPAPGSAEQAPEEPEPEAEAEEDVTPWLEKLIPSGSSVAGPPLAAAAGAAVLADWLEGNEPPSEEVAPVQAEPAAELPGWLTGVEKPGSLPGISDDNGAAPAGPETELPDWLAATGAETAPGTMDIWSEKAPPPAESAAVPDMGGELPDWLLKSESIPEADLSAETTWEAATSSEAEPAEAEPTGELPDWLLEVQAAAPEVESEMPQAEAVPVEFEPAEQFEMGSTEAESGLPDWLLEAASLEGEAIPAETEPETSEPTPSEAQSSLPDWLLGAAPYETETSSVEIEPVEAIPASVEDFSAVLPDWLQGVTLPEEEAAPAETEPVADESAPAIVEAGLPDWLQGVTLPEEEAIPAETEPAAYEPSPSEGMTGLPDWLQGVPLPEDEAIPAETEPAAYESAPAAAETGLPDWLQGVTLPEEEVVPTETEPAAYELAPSEGMTGLPDWLQGVPLPEEEAVPTETEPAAYESAPAAAETGLPDWLQGLPLPEEAAFPAETEPAAYESGPAEVEAGLPDWLLNVTPPEAEMVSPEIEPPQEESTTAEPATELPDWLLEAASLDEKLSSVTSEEAVGPASELPAWLFEAEEPEVGLPGQEAQAQPTATEIFPAESSPAAAAVELPDWLSETESLAEETLPAQAEPAVETPAWLFEAAEPGLAGEPEPAVEEQTFTPETAEPLDAGLLGWLKESTPADAEPADLQAELTPESLDWLFEPQESEKQAAGADQAGEFAGGLSDWLRESAPAGQADSSLEATPADEIPAWLFETEGAPPVSAERSAYSGSETQLGDTQPLRLKPAPLPAPVEQPEPIEQPEVVEQTEPAPGKTLELDDAFAWLMGLTAAAEVAHLHAQEAPAPEVAAVQPEVASLEAQPESDLSVEPPQVEPPIAELPPEPSAPALEAQFEPLEGPITPEIDVPEPEAQLEPVEELITTGSSVEPPAVELEEQPPVEPAASEPSLAGDDLDADTAFAWLESLAVKQGANEALILKPEERLETMPDWVRQDALAAEQAAPQPPADELETPAVEVEETSPEAALEPEPLAEAEQVELPASELVAPVPPAPEAVIDQDSAFAWLESLAVKQGANEALILKPEERLETMPDWVRQDALSAEQAAPSEMPVETEAPEPEPEEPFAVAGLETGLESEFEPVGETQAPPEELPELAQPSVAELSVAEPPVVEPAIVEQPVAPEEPEQPITPLAEEAPAWVEPIPAAPEPVVAEEQVAPVEPAPTPPLRSTGGLPELPDWLTDSVISPREELEWTPPPVPHRRYDLNQVSLSELERLPGVGFIAAQQITAYRDAHGPFSKLEDLRNVPGIGSAMIRGMHDYLFVVEPEEPELEPLESVIQLGGPSESMLAPDLAEARLQLTGGEMPLALEKYAAMIYSNMNLEHVIQDLEAAAYRFPTDIDVWQYLGDACLRVDRVQDALQAYIKAEQLLF